MVAIKMTQMIPPHPCEFEAKDARHVTWLERKNTSRANLIRVTQVHRLDRKDTVSKLIIIEIELTVLSLLLSCSRSG